MFYIYVCPVLGIIKSFILIIFDINFNNLHFFALKNCNNYVLSLYTKKFYCSICKEIF